MSLTILIISKRIGVDSLIQFRDINVLVLKEEKKKEEKNTVFLRSTLNLVQGERRKKKKYCIFKVYSLFGEVENCLNLESSWSKV